MGQIPKDFFTDFWGNYLQNCYSFFSGYNTVLSSMITYICTHIYFYFLVSVQQKSIVFVKISEIQHSTDFYVLGVSVPKKHIFTKRFYDCHIRLKNANNSIDCTCTGIQTKKTEIQPLQFGEFNHFFIRQMKQFVAIWFNYYLGRLLYTFPFYITTHGIF